MASDRSADRYQGLLIPDPRITVETLTDQGAGNTDSDYSQAGPHPGVPSPTGDADMLFQATGEMEAKTRLEVYTQRAGHPGRDGAGFLWRDSSTGDPAYNGWDPYSVVTGWETLVADESTTDDAYPTAIRLANGKIVVGGPQAVSGLIHYFYIYDPIDGTWTTRALSQAWSALQTGAALVELPSGRILWIGVSFGATTQLNVHYSDDEMATWALASARALRTPCSGAILKVSAAYSAGEVGLWLMWEDGSSNLTMSQYASDDLGLRFTQVVDDWNADVDASTLTAPAVIAGDGGGFVVAIAHRVDGVSRVYRIASAYSATQEEVDVSTLLATHPFADETPIAIWRDETGSIFVMCERLNHGEASIFISHDDARTFTSHNVSRGLDLYATGVVPTFTRFAVASASGRALMVTRWSAAGTSHDPGSLGVIHLGGYGSHTAPLGDSGTEFSDTDGIGYGDQASGGSGKGFFYVPIERPTSAGWTQPNTDGGDVITEQARAGAAIPAEAIVLETDSGAAEEGGSVSFKQTLIAEAQVFATFAVTPDKPSGSIDADDIAVKVRCASGGASYEVRYRFSDGGWRVLDATAPTSLGVVVADLDDGASLMYHRVAITVPEAGTPKVQTWYARWAPVLSWTEGPGGTLTNNAVAGASAIEFGSFNGAQGDVASWYMFGACGWGDRWSPTHGDGIGASWSLPDDLHPRNVPPLAQPALLDGSTKIAAIDGPTLRGETWTITTDYSGPIDHALSTQSPRIAWESANEGAAEIVWDLSGQSSSSFLNSSIGCALLGCNFRTAVLERWDGGAWQTLISLDAAEGFDSLKFTRAGDVATVNTGSSNTAGRYLHFDDVRGATWEDVTNSKRRIISTQTEGAWADSTAKRPRLLLKDVDGSEAASGDCRIWFPDMLGIAHEVTATPRYIRLRIPASQGTVSGTYKIGQILIGSLLIFGHQPSRGFVTSTAAGVDVATYPDGSTRAHRTGPPQRALELSWSDGVDASSVQAASAVPDYVAGTTGGLPVATRSDIARTLEGALREAASADAPVVYIGRIPTNSATPDTINNPRQFMYGRASGEYRREHITGDEVSSEVDRIATITITEVI